MWPGFDSPSCLPERKGNVCPQRSLCMNIRGSFICNAPRLVTTQPSTNRRMSKQIGTLLRNGILVNTWKEWTNNTQNAEEFWNHRAGGKNSDRNNVQTVWFKLYKNLENVTYAPVTESVSALRDGADAGEGQRKRWQKGRRKLPGMTDMFIILFVVMVSQLYTYVKTYQIMHCKRGRQWDCFQKKFDGEQDIYIMKKKLPRNTCEWKRERGTLH